MAIDLLAIEPHKISRDLREKIILLYSQPKLGKTTLATSHPKSILLAFEVGFNALAGVMAQKITKWSEFKQVLKQLEKTEVQEKFEYVAVDTLDIAYDLCEKFICQREGVDKIGDIPYGAGYKMVKSEFDDSLRRIPMLGFGLIMISHSQNATFTDENGKEYQKIVPTLPKAPRHIALSMADIIAYGKTVTYNDEEKRVLFLRGNSEFEAGSRFKHIKSVIPFDYESLVDAVAEAVEKEEEDKGQEEIVTESNNLYAEDDSPTFDELKEEIKDLTSKLVEAKGQDETKKFVKTTVETHLGKGRTLKDVTETQIEQLTLIAYDLKEVLGLK